MRPSFLLFFKYKHFFPFSQLTCLALTLQHEQKKEKNTSKYADKKRIQATKSDQLFGSRFFTTNTIKIYTKLSLESSPDSCVKCYTMFLQFLLIKIDVFS
ncbi:hypothetical protein FBF65_06815 [Enterococcus faecium]|nr:hypothetical protein FBF65_06815 [Enterococcus faecium]